MIRNPEEKPKNATVSDDAIVRVNDLKMHFPIKKGFFRRTVGYVKAVDGVNLEIKRGETLGLVGESGCGKTTIGRCITRAYKPTSGEILYTENGKTTDLAKLDEIQLKPYRKKVRMIFQDPFASLNPRMTVFDIIADPLRIHNMGTEKQIEEKVAYLLERCGLRAEFMRRYPHAFSGGQRQRIGIARVLALEPEVVVADEAVSALDVSVRAQILNLMIELQQDFDLTYLFISHDLSVVEYIADRVVVMYVGKMVETAPTNELFSNPQHPYTEALLSAIPIPDPRRRSDRIVLEGDVANPANPPKGCYFHPRCRFAKDRCKTETPELRRISENHIAACHFAEELDLRGIPPIQA